MPCFWQANGASEPHRNAPPRWGLFLRLEQAALFRRIADLIAFDMRKGRELVHAVRGFRHYLDNRDAARIQGIRDQ